MRDVLLKTVRWVGSSQKDVRAMPVNVKKEIGHALRELQKMRDPGNVKPLRHLGESGISEIVVDEREG